MIVNIIMNVIVIIMIVSITMIFTGSIVIVDPSPLAASCDDHVHHHHHHHHHHLEQHGDEMHLEKQETTRCFRCLFPPKRAGRLRFMQVFRVWVFLSMACLDALKGLDL